MKLFKLQVVILTPVLLFFLGACREEDSRKLKLTSSRALVPQESRRCLQCHTKKTPAIVDSWQGSLHAASGIGCVDCHGAEESDPDQFDHFGRTISAVISPLDCAACHDHEAQQFLGSHHAKGGEVLGSLDNYLGEVVEGLSASVSGCQQCHGSTVTLDENRRLTPETWPNFGIGRINPDGSAGSCAACHSRHDFSVAQARTPETCGRCHLGPDHPQIEIYHSSKHNIAYQSHLDEMHMDQSTWVVGQDYTAAPTCATCHVSATPNQGRTHDIGERLSWDIRAEVSFRTADWKQKEKSMKEVCMNCHNSNYVDNFYKQYGAGIELYNNKFAKPARNIMARLKKNGRIDKIPFNEHIDWIYFYLWHHEGRRARNGLAMMGADYVQWHGFYEVAERFYIEFLPEAEKLQPGITREVLSRPEHKWFNEGLTDAERRQMNEFYLKSYKE